MLLAAQHEFVTAVLQVVQRVLTRHLLEQAGLASGEGHGGVVTLIQRFSSAASLNMHLQGLLLGGVYRCAADGVPELFAVGAPTVDETHGLLRTMITRLMKLLTRRGMPAQDMGQTSLAEPDIDDDGTRPLRPLRAAADPCRMAFGPPGRRQPTQGRSLHHGMRL